MERDNADRRDMLCTGLRLTLEYLCVHAHLRELFSLQEMLSRHAADVAWYQSPRDLRAGAAPAQEMPAELREQWHEMERQQKLMAARQQPQETPHGSR